MKRFCAITILLCLCLTLFIGCKKSKYEPVESTEEEARTVMTLAVGESRYGVRYELYRTMFLTYKSAIDGGDATVWSGENSGEYISAVNSRIVKELAEIFSVFELCKRNGFDLYSDEVEDEIYEMIEISVDGGAWGEDYYEGFGGDYGAYLASLREIYHNYSTAVLLMRYEIGRRMLEELYVGQTSLDTSNGRITDGKLEYTTESVRNFYYSESAVQILQTYVPEEISYTPRELAEDIRLDVIEAAESGDEAVRVLMINRGTPTATAELESGLVVGKYSLSREYSALSDAALALREGGVSEVIETYSATDGRRYYVIYRAQKSDEFFESNYAAVVEVYLYDAIGGFISAIASELEADVEYTEHYRGIIHSEVSM